MRGMDLYVVTIQWDKDHSSPPIGPLFRAEAEEFATRARKALRRQGRYRQGAVQLKVCRSPETAESWLA